MPARAVGGDRVSRLFSPEKGASGGLAGWFKTKMEVSGALQFLRLNNLNSGTVYELIMEKFIKLNSG
jgi:hypothetical protein